MACSLYLLAWVFDSPTVNEMFVFIIAMVYIDVYTFMLATAPR